MQRDTSYSGLGDDGTVPTVDQFVGCRISHYRGKQGLSVTELATKIELEVDEILEFEAGKRKVPAQTVYVIAHALKVPMAFLFAFDRSSCS